MQGIKIILLGIALILFGIALSTNNIAAICGGGGLLLAIIGLLKGD